MDLEPATAPAAPVTCPRCGRARPAHAAAPAWQCPHCGVAYEKAARASQMPAARRRPSTTPVWDTKLQRLMSTAFLVACLILVLAWWRQGRLPDPGAIHPALLHPPVQAPIERKPFVFPYRGTDYVVRPVADYALAGLVVSHNDIEGWTDITHDADSVDIKDLCVIWGDNLRRSDYQRVHFSSGDFVCYFSYPRGVVFFADAASNNHLLARSEALREAIREVRVGDQIRLSGMLIDYCPQGAPDRWRRTSTTRQDTGNGACEVVMVEDLDVLARGTPGWYAAAAWSLRLAVGLLLAKLGLFLAAAFVEMRAAPGGETGRGARR